MMKSKMQVEALEQKAKSWGKETTWKLWENFSDCNELDRQHRHCLSFLPIDKAFHLREEAHFLLSLSVHSSFPVVILFLFVFYSFPSFLSFLSILFLFKKEESAFSLIEVIEVEELEWEMDKKPSEEGLKD